MATLLQPGGTWLQMSLQTIEDTDYPGGVSIIADRNKHQTFRTNLRFSATFEGKAEKFTITELSLSTDLETTTLRWLPSTGVTYAIDRSTDLEGVWEELTDSIESEGTETEFTPSNPSPAASRVFFRVREVPVSNNP